MMIIPKDKISKGTLLCQKNVDRYMAEAYLLENNGSYGHALASAILGMEEYAKKLVLYAYAMSPVEESKDLDDAFKYHKPKLRRIAEEVSKILPTRLGANELKKALDEAATILDKLKLSGLYVDYDNDVGWIDPNRLELKGQSHQNISVLAKIIQRIEPLLSEH